MGGEEAVGAATRASRANHFALVLLFVIALTQLAGVAVASAAFDEVADASPFGRLGTVVACAVIAVVAFIGVVVAWRAVAGKVRVVTAVAVFIAVGVVALMGLSLVIAGGVTMLMAIELALAALLIGLIGRAVLQPARRSEP